MLFKKETKLKNFYSRLDPFANYSEYWVMQSMTGFGAAHSADLGFSLSIRSVNGRYLEPRFHLSKEWMPLESELKKLLSQKVSRGTVDIYIQTKKTFQKAGGLVVNRVLAKEYIKASETLLKLGNSKLQPLSVEALMALPSVLEMPETSQVTGRQKAALIQLFKKALDRMVHERSREGRVIANEMRSHLKVLESLQKKMAAFRARANSELENRLRSRLASRGVADLDSARVAQELIFYLDRNDIQEELSRLAEHIQEVKKLLQSGAAIGKKLDFFAQELLREVNTIGSKSHLVELTQLVVEAKTRIESLREQVQNIQ